jgi:hypothetical protein
MRHELTGYGATASVVDSGWTKFDRGNPETVTFDFARRK